jgi:hypothetical protein
MTEEEEEKKLTRLEKRLVANFDFDDHSKCWVFIQIFTTCWDTSVGCNSPMECR